MLNVLLVTVLENVLVYFTCLQHKFSDFKWHGIEYPFLFDNIAL